MPTRSVSLVTAKFHNVFSIISAGTPYRFNENILEDLFLDIREDMDQIYQHGGDTIALMPLYQCVQAVVNQFDDRLQAGLLMKMDVMATLLSVHGMVAPQGYVSTYHLDSDCVAIDFSGLFFEEALSGPWEPSAENYHLNGDWIEWHNKSI